MGKRRVKFLSIWQRWQLAAKSWQLFIVVVRSGEGAWQKEGVPSDNPRKFLIIFKSFLINIPSERLPSCKLQLPFLQLPNEVAERGEEGEREEKD